MGEKLRLGLAICGSYCTYDKLFSAAEHLKEKYELIPIWSETASKTQSRFGTPEENRRRIYELTGREPVCTIAGAEPLGPEMPMAALLIAPCTGNTLSKLRHGITDSAVLMAAKAQLRNGRPVIIALSTNDGLSGSAENIAGLLNRKNIYFVPFYQDAPEKKPSSLQADFSLLADSVEAAIAGEQLQPVLTGRAKP